MTISFARIGKVLNRERMRTKMLVLASLVRAEWIRLAKHDCGPSVRDDYVLGIQPVSMPISGRGMSVSVVLAGVLPNLVERGWDGRDMRKTLLQPGAKGVKRSKRGFLSRVIFFRHLTTSAGDVDANGSAMLNNKFVGTRAVGATHWRILNKSGSKRAMSVTLLVEKQELLLARMRKLSGTTTLDQNGKPPTGKMDWGGRLRQQEDPFEKARDRHKASLHKNLYKFKAAYGKRTQNTYGTFRTISNDPRFARSDADGMNWFHPGVRAHAIAPRVVQYIRPMVDRVLWAPA